jgi:hypothetical protein
MQSNLTTYGVCSADTLRSIFPADRSKTDAVRAAAAYALLKYQRFHDRNGRLCKAIAKSPKSATKKGMDIQIHVQACSDDTVEYSQLVARLSAPTAQSTPELIREKAAEEFPDLCKDLHVKALREQGQDNLYDNDIRKLLEGLLDPYTVSLWKGLSLVLDETGLAYIHTLQWHCDAVLSAGKVSLSTLALDMSQANREALARELADEFATQLHKIAERCAYTAPNAKAIVTTYETLASKITQAETLLGVAIPCHDAQLAAETAIMALD